MGSLSSGSVLAGVAAALAIAATPSSTWAFCRSTTCQSLGVCQPSSDQCLPLLWKRTCVGISLDQDASRQITYDVMSPLLDRAFSAWNADCGDGKGPGIRVQNLGAVACGEVQYNAREKGKVFAEGNANVVTFRDLAWPADTKHNPSQIALTTVQFLSSTGEIVGADMEVDSANFNFDPNNANDGRQFVDLQAVITHEAGHFFGLAHSSAPGATMTASYDQSADFSTLSQDDVDGICTIYPPTDLSGEACNPIPVHGFSPDCADQQVVGCGFAPADRAPARPGAPAELIAVAAAALAAARRRRRS